jgi:hypothetical protein
MTEHTDNLILGILKQIQTDQAAFRKEIEHLRDDIRTLTRLSFRFEQDISMLRSDNLTIVERLERIEKRLELVD